ncbi:MAG TPA: potassium/proton antiporter [Nitriliruptorales bacterium]|nr:potassium/proton antiporter [Nitriliruptorales bacterium]
MAVRFAFATDWFTALLLGAVVSSTDAAAVFALLKRTPLPRRIGSILEVESGANDPFAIVLTVGLLATWEAGATWQQWVAFGTRQLLGGLLVGLLVGLAGSWLLRRVRLAATTLYPVLALGLGGLAYAVGARVGASGFLAIYIAGLFVGALVPRHRRIIRNFHTSLANTADIGLFLLLGLLVFPSRLPGVALRALAVTGLLVFLARPAAVALALTPFRIPWRDQLVAAWAGLRGAVPIVLSTFPFTAGFPQGDAIFDVVFFVVLASMLLQGSTVAPLIERLGLTTPRPAWESIAEAIPLEGVDADLVELTITEQLAIANKEIRDVPPPAGMLVASIVRDGRVILPTGSTRFEPGDLAVIAFSRDTAGLNDVTAWARGESSPQRTDEPSRSLEA